MMVKVIVSLPDVMVVMVLSPATRLTGVKEPLRGRQLL